MRLRLLPSILLFFVAVPAFAQEHLSLADAVRQALAQNPAIRATDAAAGEAAERVTQARAGYLPHVSLSESTQHGNQPLFAFGSLLSARQITPSDFAVDALNNPSPISSYHTTIGVEQVLFDGFRTQSATRSAVIGRTLAQTEQRQARQDIALAATRAYGQVLLASAGARAADSAVTTAEEDVRRAERRRDAGLATEADVLALQVHLARMRERQIQNASDETIARAELNQAMGEPLDRTYTLDEAAAAAPAVPSIAQLEQEALASRSETKSAQMQEALARESQRGARAALLPQVSVQGLVDLTGMTGSWGNRASAWLVGAQLRWNVFSGLGDLARLRETALATTRAGADRERVDTSIRLDVRTAAARVQSAIARERVGQAAVAQARESQRIMRDRYEAGMTSVNDVLRAANALLDAESQRTGALVDLLVSNAMLERALGRSPADAQK